MSVLTWSGGYVLGENNDILDTLCDECWEDSPEFDPEPERWEPLTFHTPENQQHCSDCKRLLDHYPPKT